jgi:4-hydroxy-3-polyprenylbenzoate decarboxylase
MKLAILISGASGSTLAKKLIETIHSNHELFVVASKEAKWIFEKETGESLENFLKNTNCKQYDNEDFSSPLASGSFRLDAAVVIPCSAKTLSSIANGYASNLISRCADVCIKEKRKLILVFRETPISTIHIENMLKVSLAGATILPPVLSFYSNPKTIQDMVNFIVGKVLDNLGIDNEIYKRWE